MGMRNVERVMADLDLEDETRDTLRLFAKQVSARGIRVLRRLKDTAAAAHEGNMYPESLSAFVEKVVESSGLRMRDIAEFGTDDSLDLEDGMPEFLGYHLVATVCRGRDDFASVFYCGNTEREYENDMRQTRMLIERVIIAAALPDFRDRHEHVKEM